MSMRSWDSSGEAREALQLAVDGYGPAVLSNPRILSNFFKDVLPDSPREASVLVSAADCDVAGMLQQQVAQRMEPDAAVRLTAATFGERRAIDPTAGLWATGEMARALGFDVNAASVSVAPVGVAPVGVGPVGVGPGDPGAAGVA